MQSYFSFLMPQSYQNNTCIISNTGALGQSFAGQSGSAVRRWRPIHLGHARITAITLQAKPYSPPHISFFFLWRTHIPPSFITLAPHHSQQAAFTGQPPHKPCSLNKTEKTIVVSQKMPMMQSQFIILDSHLY